MPFITKRTVLFGDCDPGGVIYTPRVAYFAVEAVHEFLADALGGPAIRELFSLGILPPARSLSIEFLSPCTWDDELIIEVSPARVGGTSFTCQVIARKEDAVVFRAALTQVCICPETQRPVPLPERLAHALNAALAPNTPG